MGRLFSTLLLSTRRAVVNRRCFSTVLPPPRFYPAPRLPSPSILPACFNIRGCHSSTSDHNNTNSTPSSSDKEFKSRHTEVEKQVKIEIISKENIKPASSTPPDLATYNISSLDQLAQPTPVDLVLFYPNMNNDNNVSDRLRHLKQSLSETLTQFYPFAGKIKDDISIDCNDEGVYYVETRVNRRLSDYFSKFDFRLIQGLVPDWTESNPARMYLLAIQVNLFDCGGIVISGSLSHRLADGSSYATFFKSWAAISSGYLQIVSPSFITPSFFPPNPSLSKFPLPFRVKDDFSTRRFVFNASGLVALKTKLSSPSSPRDFTRVQVVLALIWKCLTVASRKKTGSKSRPSFFGVSVNMRKRSSPPLPEAMIGNIIWSGVAKAPVGTELDLSHMANLIAESIRVIDEKFVEEIKGDRGYLRLINLVKELGEQFPTNCEFDLFAVTSMCNFGLYEVDFGWGKPAWVHFFNPGNTNIIVLADTKSGDGIEACVTLSGEDMATFELDPELLAFASTEKNNNPLQL